MDPIENSRPGARGASEGGLAWPRVLPFAVFIALMALEPWVADLVAPVFDPRWLYALRALVTGLLLLALWRHYAELRERPDSGLGVWVTGAAVGVVVFGFWILLDVPPLVLGEAEHPFDPRVDGRSWTALAFARLAGAALVVPLMEELFWRSFLMRWLERPRFLSVDPGAVGWKPLVISSAVFAVEHRLWFAGLLAGLLYGELYRRTRSLPVVILAHAITNALLGLYVVATGSWAFW